jgi:spore germination cell wall hydrolase CwlJ-like protein
MTEIIKTKRGYDRTLTAVIIGVIGLVMLVAVVSPVRSHGFVEHYNNEQSRITIRTLPRIRHSSDYDLSLLATACARESSGQSATDKIAVISVIINRSENQSIETTLLARGQFQWANSRSIRRVINNDEYRECLILARDYVNHLDDYRHISELSLLFFHNRNVNPRWPYTRRLETRNHIFYSGF